MLFVCKLWAEVLLHFTLNVVDADVCVFLCYFFSIHFIIWAKAIEGVAIWFHFSLCIRWALYSAILHLTLPIDQKQQQQPTANELLCMCSILFLSIQIRLAFAYKTNISQWKTKWKAENINEKKRRNRTTHILTWNNILNCMFEFENVCALFTRRWRGRSVYGYRCCCHNLPTWINIIQHTYIFLIPHSCVLLLSVCFLFSCHTYLPLLRSSSRRCYFFHSFSYFFLSLTTSRDLKKTMKYRIAIAISRNANVEEEDNDV